MALLFFALNVTTISASLISGVELVSTTSNSDEILELLEILRVSGVLEVGKFTTLKETEKFLLRPFVSMFLDVPVGENTWHDWHALICFFDLHFNIQGQVLLMWPAKSKIILKKLLNNKKSTEFTFFSAFFACILGTSFCHVSYCNTKVATNVTNSLIFFWRHFLTLTMKSDHFFSVYVFTFSATCSLISDYWLSHTTFVVFRKFTFSSADSFQISVILKFLFFSFF